MRLRSVLLVVAALDACGGGGDDKPQGPPVVRFRFPPGLVKLGSLSIGGVSGKGHDDHVDIPIAKLPADLRTLKVTASFPTPCGVKVITGPLSENESPPGADKYQARPESNSEFQLVYDTGLPHGNYPTTTRVFLDPTMSGPLSLGKLSGTVTNGIPDDKLAVTPPHQASEGFLVNDLECGAQVTVDGQSEAIPLRPSGALFVTARQHECFFDQSVGYGNETSGGERLQDSHVYRLRATEYPKYFVAADSHVQTSARDLGASVNRLDVCGM